MFRSNSVPPNPCEGTLTRVRVTVQVSAAGSGICTSSSSSSTGPAHLAMIQSAGARCSKAGLGVGVGSSGQLDYSHALPLMPAATAAVTCNSGAGGLLTPSAMTPLYLPTKMEPASSVLFGAETELMRCVSSSSGGGGGAAAALHRRLAAASTQLVATSQANARTHTHTHTHTHAATNHYFRLLFYRPVFPEITHGPSKRLVADARFFLEEGGPREW